MPITTRLHRLLTTAPLIFFVSGAASLIHEVAWTRLLRLIIGNTTYAITTVLGVFMAGLALGGWLGGRMADRQTHGLRVFGYLEAAIGLYCLLLPWVIGWFEPIYQWIYQQTHTTTGLFFLLRILFCAALLLPPATMMGATLPILTRFFVRSGVEASQIAGRLYAINTLGAMAGTIIAGFILIPNFGVRLSIVTGSLLNILIAVIAIAMSRMITHAEHDNPSHNAPAAIQPPGIPIRHILLLSGYAASGFAAMTYEIAWSRTLSLLIGSSVYAFSLMLAAFICGLGLGSWLWIHFAGRLQRPMRTLGVMQIAIAFSALAVVPLFDRAPDLTAQLLWSVGQSFWGTQAAQFMLAFSVMLIPTLLMGAAFPVACQIMMNDTAHAGRSVGNLYAINTLGSIAGSFATGFLLIPYLGLQWSLMTAITINACIGATLLLWGERRSVTRLRILSATGSLAVIATIIVVLPAWDPGTLSLGPYLYSRVKERPKAGELKKQSEQTKVVYHREGVITTVTVKQNSAGALTLLVNGKVDASTSGDLETQLLLGQIPALLHPDPKDALVIGLASGITLGTVGSHPVTTLECAEISPAVVEACRLFSVYNRRILDDPRTHILQTDGRNHLALTSRQYDLIVSEPSNPWIAGVADLFTLEFFQTVHDRLRDGGVACVWLEIYNTDLEAFQSVARSFSQVFEDASLWSPMEGDYFFLGTRHRPPVDIQTIQTRLNNTHVKSEIERLGPKTIEDILAYRVMGPEALRAFAHNARLHTDDNALLEFSTPRSMSGPSTMHITLGAIENHRDTDLSYLTSADADALAALRKNVARRVKATGVLEQAEIQIDYGSIEPDFNGLKEAFKDCSDQSRKGRLTQSLFNVASKLVKSERIAEAMALYRGVVEMDPDHRDARHNYAVFLNRTGQKDAALEQFQELYQRHPDHLNALFHIGFNLEQLDRLPEAVAAYRQLISKSPNEDVALNQIARLLATRPSLSKNSLEAIAFAEKACALTNRRNALALDTLGMAMANAGRFAEAMQVAAEAFRIAAAERDMALAQAIRERGHLYQSRRPYHLTETSP